MLLLEFSCTPKRSSSLNKIYGGAFITCWIDQSDLKNAEVFARGVLDAEGWQIQRLNHIETIARSDFDNGHSPEGLALFEEATRYGSAIKIHTYPNDASPSSTP